MCIKTVKITQKCEKPQGEASMEAWSTKKMEMERMEKMKWWLPLHANLICVVISPLPLIFTKLPLCHSDLQKCHSGPQMLTH